MKGWERFVNSIYPFRYNEYVSMMHQEEGRQSYVEFRHGFLVYEGAGKDKEVDFQYPIYEGVKHVQAWQLNELL